MTEVAFSFIFSFILIFLIIQVCNKIGIVKDPLSDRFRDKAVPFIGGLGFIIAAPLMLANIPFYQHWIVMGSLVLFLLGFYDDFYIVHPYSKLIIQTVVAVTLALGGFRFHIFDSYILNNVLSIVWIVGLINAFNLMDNMDGLAIGIAGIIFFIFYCLTGNIMALILLGTCLAFLMFNFPPASIFMGDCGSMFLGYWIAVFSLWLQPDFNMSMGIALIVFILFMDTSWVIIFRTVERRSIFIGGTDHISHMIVHGGNTERKTILIMWLITVVTGFIGYWFIGAG
ncbi:hypothetical protein LCGC14_1116070 [marine sediment metagenome]|uniref:Undecaprenyl/decaprenyl-phosphate alpha-N-acetylglucosaminyl 1-phosphate transferase n=1 Tax=marine sediment metagenome TaxID=412755 RepID=A0A0F9MA41_9ZZZZ